MPAAAKKINKTDPDAVFMKTTNGIKTSYNAQAAVDAEHQVIVAADVEQLLPMVEQTTENTSPPYTVATFRRFFNPLRIL